MLKVPLQPLRSADREAAVELLAQAYLTNPLHLAAFGGLGATELELNRVFFGEGIRSIFGEGFTAARADGQLVGLMRMVRSPACNPARAVARCNRWFGINAQARHGVPGLLEQRREPSTKRLSIRIVEEDVSALDPTNQGRPLRLTLLTDSGASDHDELSEPVLTRIIHKLLPPSLVL
jgi:hypothetical protein